VEAGRYFVAEYQYEGRHQVGFDFVAGTTSPTIDANERGVTLSPVVNW